MNHNLISENGEPLDMLLLRASVRDRIPVSCAFYYMKNDELTVDTIVSVLPSLERGTITPYYALELYEIVISHVEQLSGRIFKENYPAYLNYIFSFISPYSMDDANFINEFHQLECLNDTIEPWIYDSNDQAQHELSNFKFENNDTVLLQDGNVLYRCN